MGCLQVRTLQQQLQTSALALAAEQERSLELRAQLGAYPGAAAAAAPNPMVSMLAQPGPAGMDTGSGSHSIQESSCSRGMCNMYLSVGQHSSRTPRQFAGALCQCPNKQPHTNYGLPSPALETDHPARS
jgi:hypothetical protein